MRGSNIIRARSIGTFEASEAFLAASEDTLEEMQTMHIAWRYDHNDEEYQARFGDVLDYFGQLETPGAQIYTSFLGRVALDLKSLVSEEAAVSELPATVYMPQIIRYDPARPDKFHRDTFEENATLGVRYLSANRDPTIIPELGRTDAGTIYRMSNRFTFHKRPKVSPSRIPRSLLIINF